MNFEEAVFTKEQAYFRFSLASQVDAYLLFGRSRSGRVADRVPRNVSHKGCFSLDVDLWDYVTDLSSKALQDVLAEEGHNGERFNLSDFALRLSLTPSDTYRQNIPFGPSPCCRLQFFYLQNPEARVIQLVELSSEEDLDLVETDGPKIRRAIAELNSGLESLTHP